MIFLMDVGNSNICFGIFEENSPTEIAFERISTNLEKTCEEYEKDIEAVFLLHRINPAEIKKIGLSSVVPKLTDILSDAAKKFFKLPVLIVSSEIPLPFHFNIDNPKELGADIICDLAGACSYGEMPFLTIDMGTATVLSFVDSDAVLQSVSILPGVRTSINAMAESTSALPNISLKAPQKAIASNTEEAMKSGIVFGEAGMIDGLIDELEIQTGMKPEIYATGGLSSFIIPYCRHKIHLEPGLLMRGLWEIVNAEE